MSLEAQIETLNKNILDLNINIAAAINRLDKSAAGAESPKSAKGGKSNASTPTAATSQTTAEPATPAPAAPAASAANSAKGANKSADTAAPVSTNTSQPSPDNSTAADSGVSLAAVTESFKALAKAKGRDAVVAVLSEVGAATLGDVKPEQFAAFKDALDTALLM